MRIERISENQIKCYLTKKDLESRHLSVKELASGGFKTTEFFNEMMDEARKLDFVPDGAPLSIEAVSTNSDGITIVITKMEKSAMDLLKSFGKLIGLSSIMDDVKSTFNTHVDADSIEDSNRNNKDICAFLHYDGDSCKKAVDILKQVYAGDISIYRNPSSRLFYLIIHKGKTSKEDFDKVCNMMLEFGAQVKAACTSLAYYYEHYELIYSGDISKA